MATKIIMLIVKTNNYSGSTIASIASAKSKSFLVTPLAL
jgi:hypothetical protein